MIRVGCCGFPVSKKNYYEAFSLVELNRTFYEYPRLQTVAKWRKEAPEEFEFTVKAHQDISHKYRLKLEVAKESFSRMKDICRTLNTKILLVQTPASFRPESLGEAKEFFEGIDRDELTLVWETRGPLWGRIEVQGQLKKVLERLEISHVTDPFKTMPVYMGHTAYFRLHGLGERIYYYQYSDEELLRLHDLVKPLNTSDRNVYLLFNNLSMFEDAKRFVSFMRHGLFPPLTEEKGLDSVKAVISKVRYPITRGFLMRRMGWRLVELEDGKQVRLEELLKSLSSRTFRNVDDVTSEMRFQGL